VGIKAEARRLEIFPMSGVYLYQLAAPAWSEHSCGYEGALCGAFVI